MRSLVAALAARLWARPALLLWLPPLFWAGNLVLGRALGPTFPPVSLAVGRWLVALAVLAPFVARRAYEQRHLLRRHATLIFGCGAFGIAGYNALGYLALQTVPAASVAFLNSTSAADGAAGRICARRRAGRAAHALRHRPLLRRRHLDRVARRCR
jgi:drug/metabolite transporter (DMT)-like permease